jgi:hypothetical protein
MKTITKTQAKKRAWKIFSQYVRLLARDRNGFVACYTCGRKYPYKKMQTGHWVTGHGNSIYINEDFVRPQCYSCNIMKGGNLGEFRDKIRKELGGHTVDQLLIIARDTKKITVEDYQELERYYKEQVDKLDH